jgi:hypothetical protein
MAGNRLTEHPVMHALHERMPISLLLDVLGGREPESAELYRSEPGDASWLPDAASDRLDESGGSPRH